MMANTAFAQSTPDSEEDCLEAAKLLLAELQIIDPEHGFTQHELTQQIYIETNQSGGGPYLCQAYRLMGEREDGTLASIALEYYADPSQP
jgi:hypothetical protein